MLKIYNCIATAHDLRLVVLAAIVCALSSFAAFRLLHHARTAQGQMRDIWLAVAAVAIGFGIWATHFIAMLAFSPGIPSGYNIALTALSLVAAMLLTGCGLVVAMIPGWRASPALGGAIVAGGIAAMHYTGMAAFEIAGIVVWDYGMVAWSVVLGAALGAIALPVGLHDPSEKWKTAGAALLTLAICSHHFTGMAAVTILPDPNIAVPATALPSALLAILVCAASLAIILLSLTAVALDVRDRRRAALETDRMRGLANAAVEGLVVCDGDTIVTVNESFAELVGLSSAMLVGNKLDLCLPDETARERLLTSSNQSMEVTLRHHDGSTIPAEVILRPIDYAGRPHHVAAVRDLRSRKKNEQHIRYLAHHDALTSLPNRTSFNAAIDEALASLPTGDKLAVFCPISTASRKSTTCSVMRQATRCYRRSPIVSAACSATGRSCRASAATSSRSCCRMLPALTPPAGLPKTSSPRCASRAIRRRPTASPAASGSRSIRTMPTIARCFLPMPIPRCTAPRPRAVTPIASSRRRWAPRSANGG